MPMAKEDERVGNPLVVAREPKGPKRAGDKGTMGDQALQDAMLIVGLCWVAILLYMFSLRGHIV